MYNIVHLFVYWSTDAPSIVYNQMLQLEAEKNLQWNVFDWLVDWFLD